MMNLLAAAYGSLLLGTLLPEIENSLEHQPKRSTWNLENVKRGRRMTAAMLGAWHCSQCKNRRNKANTPVPLFHLIVLGYQE
jgi:hypothetical protein